MLQFLSLSILLTNCLLRKLERTITCIFAIQLCQQSSPSIINMLMTMIMMLMMTTIMVMLGFITTGVLCIPPDSVAEVESLKLTLDVSRYFERQMTRFLGNYYDCTST